MVGRVHVMILTESRAALQVIRVVGTRGKARTRGLVQVVPLISEIEDKCGEKSVSLA